MPYVCLRCIADEFVRDKLSEHLVHNECDYCEATAPEGTDIAADEDDLHRIVERAVYEYLDIPENVHLRDSESETGWAGEVTWGPEAVREYFGDFTDNDYLRDSIASRFNDLDLCDSDYGQLDFAEAMRSAWGDFCGLVIHESRYFFQHKPIGEYDNMGGEITGQQFLERISSLVRPLNLITEVTPSDMIWVYRSHIHKPEETLSTAYRLGAPPREHAVLPNRMSAAGIPMFYGGLDAETAEAEVLASLEPGPACITTCGWRIAQPLKLLDLRDTSPLPSIFDVDRRSLRDNILFLRLFAKEIAIPVPKDRLTHIEYVPTQVVTEYFRRVFQPVKLDKKSVDYNYRRWPVGLHGILYRSSLNSMPNGFSLDAEPKRKDCVVLFAENQHCGDIRGRADTTGVEPWILLDPSTINTREITQQDRNSRKLTAKQSTKRKTK